MIYYNIEFNFEQILERKIDGWSLWWVGRLWPKSWIINRQLAFIAKRHPTLLVDIHYFLATYDLLSIIDFLHFAKAPAFRLTFTKI